MSRLIPKTLGIMNHEAIQGRRKVWKSGVASRHNLSPLVEIGLNDPPKSGFAMAPPAPPGTTRLSIPIYIIQSISDCFVLRLFLMHPWPFQTKNSHVHEVRKHRHHNSDLLDLCQKGGKRKENAPTLKVNHFKSNLNERFFVSKESDSETFLPPSWPQFLVSLGTPSKKMALVKGAWTWQSEI